MRRRGEELQRGGGAVAAGTLQLGTSLYAFLAAVALLEEFLLPVPTLRDVPGSAQVPFASLRQGVRRPASPPHGTARRRKGV